MMEPIAWMILALIHIMPALAAMRPTLIITLYGINRGDTAFLLLHHRAALFAVIVVICIWAVFDVDSRRVASVAVAISMLSFLLIFASNGHPQALKTIAIVDVIGLPALAFVGWRAFLAD